MPTQPNINSERISGTILDGITTLSATTISASTISIGNLTTTTITANTLSATTISASTIYAGNLTANTFAVFPIVTNANTAQTINLSLSDQFMYTLTGNTSFTFSNNGNGKSWIVAVNTNPTTSGYTGTFTATTASIKWAYGITPVMTSETGKTDMYSFVQMNGIIYGDYSQSY